MKGRCASESYCVIKSYAIWKSQKISYKDTYFFVMVKRYHRKSSLNWINVDKIESIT